MFKNHQSNKIFKYGTLSLLYFVQGAPYGFQTGCLPLILRQSGLSFSSLGAMKLLFIPWVCKPIYAPLIENTRTKQWWLLSSISVLGITCLSASFTQLNMMTSLLIILFLLNLASAVQDICVDSLALEVLEPGELGAGNTIQVVAYKAGSVFAGALLLWVKEVGSWSLMWTSFSCLYLLCLLLILSLELGYKNKTKNNLKTAEDKSDKSSSEPSLTINFLLQNWKRLLEVPGTHWMISYVLFYKLCERGEGTLPLYLVDKGVPMSKLAFWNGIVRSAASIGGSTIGGCLLSTEKFKPGKLMLYTAALRVIPISIQFFLILLWGYSPVTKSLDGFNIDSIMFYLSILTLCVANFTAGLITTSCFTSMMTISQSAPSMIQTSHYSLLSTCEVLGKLMFASIAGALIDMAGLLPVFAIFVTFSIATIPLILKMPDLDVIKLKSDKS